MENKFIVYYLSNTVSPHPIRDPYTDLPSYRRDIKGKEIPLIFKATFMRYVDFLGHTPDEEQLDAWYYNIVKPKSFKLHREMKKIQEKTGFREFILGLPFFPTITPID